MNPPQTDPVEKDDSELKRVIQEIKEEVRRSRVTRFDTQSLAWLALPPAWTEPLAASCKFPIGSSTSLLQFVDRARAAGLLTVQTETQGESEPVRHFWMPDNVRTDVLEQLRTGNERGHSLVEQEAFRCAERILEARSNPQLRISSPVLRWAELAMHARTDLSGAASRLITEVLRLARDDQTGEARAWVETGTLLAQVLGRDLEPALRIAEHQVELAVRRVQDRRRRRDFVVRSEALAAFERLLDIDTVDDHGRSTRSSRNQRSREGPFDVHTVDDSRHTSTGIRADQVLRVAASDVIRLPDDPWALHYFGIGGVGKTMLLRYITTEVARERQLVTARIDFDYLSPNYPMHRPGELLLALADELRLHDTTQQADRLFTQLQHGVADLNQQLEKAFGQTDLGFLHMPEFQTVISQFVELVHLLPPPVVLILDTTEELAKVGPAQPNVKATFEVLERVHEAVDREHPERSIRVVFSGRRPLARAGFNWSLKPEAGLTEGRAYLPERKDYLAMYELRGFDNKEVTQFFAKMQVQLEDEMRQAILARSLEPGSAAEIVWTGDRTSTTGPRYNPVDLDLYTSWVREEPKLQVHTITAGGSDPHIRHRIAGRLREGLMREQVLPAAVVLRHFDCEMLRPALEVDDNTFDELFRELKDQEWITFQRDVDLQTTFLVVDRNLYPRLRQFYEAKTSGAEMGNPDQQQERQERMRQWDQVKHRLGPALAKLVLGRAEQALNQLRIQHIDAALRALPPHEAAALWDEVSARVAAQAEWSWAARVTAHLLGAEGEVSAREHPLRAGVRATYNASQIHTLPDDHRIEDLTEEWAEVAETASAYPRPATAAWLRARAAAGIIAMCRVIRRRPDRDKLESFWAALDADRQTRQPLKTVRPDARTARVARILTIDGSGMGALIPALVLAEIERRTGRPIAELFDLIAGVSAGGLLALSLAKPDQDGQPQYTAEDVVELLSEQVPGIFHRASLTRGLTGPKYPGENMEHLLARYFGDTPLSNALTGVLVPTYEIERHTPFWFTSTGAREPNNWSYQRLMRDAVRASLATPLYFAPAQLDRQAGLGPFTLVDGWVFAPNPALYAYIQVARDNHIAADFLVLSLGTATADLASLHYDEVKRWGVMQWLPPLWDMVTRSASEMVDRSLAALLPPANGTQRYYRFQAHSEDRAELQFDVTDRQSLSRLRAQGERLIRDSESTLDQVCHRLNELAQSQSYGDEAGADEATGERVRQLLASYCAAVEALLELAKTDGQLDLIPDAGRLINWAATVERRPGTADLVAFAFCLAGRALALHARWTAASRAFGRSETALSRDRREAPLQRWADWRAPVSLPDRVRLEWLCTLPPNRHSIPDETLAGWQAAATSRLDFLDSERLASAILQEQLAHGIVPLAKVTALVEADHYPPERKLESDAPQAHRSTPPLVCRLALALATLGQGETAWGILEDRGRHAAARGDGEVSDAVALAQLHVVRRLRLAGHVRGLVAKLSQSADEVLVCALWPVIAVNSPASGDDWSRPAPPDGRSPAVLHAWWASQPGLTRAQAEAALQTLQAAWPVAHRQLQAVRSAGLEVLLELDWQEAMQLAKIWGLPCEARPFPAAANNWLQDHPTETLVALQLACRAMALGQEIDLDTWADEVGKRRMAEVVFEEGELLALRLPGLAVRLFDAAHDRFKQAGDPAGRAIASIRSTIALLHAGDLGAARQRLDAAVPAAYRAWAEASSDSGLPPWDALVAWSLAEDPAQGWPDLDHPDWGGWLLRLFECLVWVQTSDRVDGAPITRKQEGWLKQLTRKQEGWLKQLPRLAALTGNAGLPVELDLSLGHTGSREVGEQTPSLLSDKSIKVPIEAVAGVAVVLVANAVPWLRSRLTAKTRAEVRIEDAMRRAQRV
jgi:predicted acylesterase/phospholipase RssA